MSFKKSLFALGVALIAGVLAACSQKAPDLSFEETIKAYEEQNQSLVSAFDLLTAKEGVLNTKVNGTIGVDLGAGEKGKLILKGQSFSDAVNHDQESNVDLQLDVQSQQALIGTAVNATVKLGLDAIVKEYVPYFQLRTLDMNADGAMADQIGMLSGLVSGFKQKWFTLSGVDLKEFFALQEQKDLFTGALMQNKVEHYTGIQKTEYEGQPAWKVGLNVDLIKEDVKKALSQSFEASSGEVLSGEDLALQQKQVLTEMITLIDSVRIENVDAYFVIYAKDNIKFVIKNADVFVGGETKISIKQAVKKTEYEGEISVLPVLSGESLSGGSLSGSVVNPVMLNYQVKGNARSKFVVKATLSDNGNQYVSLDGTLAFVLGEKELAVKPDFKLLFDTTSLVLQGDYTVAKIAEHSFQAPKDVQDFRAVLSSLFGIGLEDQIDPALMSGEVVLSTGVN